VAVVWRRRTGDRVDPPHRDPPWPDTHRAEAADTCAAYLERHKAYVHYDAGLAAGLPLATGVIEGACRHLIRDRMTVTGARWSLTGAEAILRLRSLRASGDWDDYWRHHEQKERERNHAARYANDRIPQLQQPDPASRRKSTARHLRVVK
jgi:hypothetical protein